MKFHLKKIIFDAKLVQIDAVDFISFLMKTANWYQFENWINLATLFESGRASLRSPAGRCLLSWCAIQTRKECIAHIYFELTRYQDHSSADNNSWRTAKSSFSGRTAPQEEDMEILLFKIAKRILAIRPQVVHISSPTYTFNRLDLLAIIFEDFSR